MDLWTKFTAAIVQFTPWLVDIKQWLVYALNSAWFWFFLAMLGVAWISRRFVVNPLARLIEFRTQVTQMDSRFHNLANELKYVRVAVDELRAGASSLKEEHKGIEDVRMLVDELRSIANSLKNERVEGELLRGAVDEIRSSVNSLKNEYDERTEELRSGLNSLARDYEQAAAD